MPGEPYRHAAEVAEYRDNRDPVVLFRKALLAAQVGEAQLAALQGEVAREVADAIRFGEEIPLPDVATLDDYLYSRPLRRSSAPAA